MAETAKKQSLKEKLLEEQKGSGQVSVSSGDFADFEQADKRGEATAGSVASPVPQEASAEPMMRAGSVGDAGAALHAEVAGKRGLEPTAADFSGASMDTNVNLSEEDRNAFIQAMVSGKRFELAFTTFNGRVSGLVRARRQSEGQAIIMRLQAEIGEDQLVSQMDYAIRMRNMLLTAQIAELQDKEFDALEKPLKAHIEADGSETPPGWLGRVGYWDDKDDGFVSAIYEELKLFEQKYWAMVMNANDQNFWNPAAST